MQAVDIFTCRQLQCRAPTISKIDQAFIESGIETKNLFPLIQNIEEREKLLKKILSVQAPSQFLIPTIFTLFENLKLLEVPATILKSLLDIKLHDKKCPISIYQAFKSIYLKNQQLKISYQKLWFFTLTNFAEMVPTTPRKEKKKAKPRIKEPNPMLWGKLASMAFSFGFDSSTIREIISASQQDTEERVQKLILMYPHFESHHNLIAEVLDAINDNPYQYHTSYDEKNMVDESIERRLGRPFEAAYNCNFTLEFNNCDIQNGVVTSELVLRTIFWAFFGEPTEGMSEEPIQPRLSPRLSTSPRLQTVSPVQAISPVPSLRLQQISPVTIAEFQEAIQSKDQSKESKTQGSFTIHIQKHDQDVVTLQDISWVRLQSMMYELVNLRNESYIIKDKNGLTLTYGQVKQEEEIFLVQVP